MKHISTAALYLARDLGALRHPVTPGEFVLDEYQAPKSTPCSPNGGQRESETSSICSYRIRARCRVWRYMSATELDAWYGERSRILDRYDREGPV